MINRIKDKTVLITGATSGIGLATARLLDTYGVKLILVGRNLDKLKELHDALHHVTQTIVLDVRNKAQTIDALSKLPTVDILINNAGLALGQDPIDEGDIQQWETMIDTNIKGVLYVTRTILPKMRAQNSGHVVNIGSIAGRAEYPGGNVYSATKAALHSLTQSMNIDVVNSDIRVSNIAPGAVQTNFSVTRFDGDIARADDVYKDYEPLQGEDVADLIAYVLNAPKHVNIQDALIMPTAQRNPFVKNIK